MWEVKASETQEGKYTTARCSQRLLVWKCLMWCGERKTIDGTTGDFHFTSRQREIKASPAKLTLRFGELQLTWSSPPPTLLVAHVTIATISLNRRHKGTSLFSISLSFQPKLEHEWSKHTALEWFAFRFVCKGACKSSGYHSFFGVCVTWL